MWSSQTHSTLKVKEIDQLISYKQQPYQWYSRHIMRQQWHGKPDPGSSDRCHGNQAGEYDLVQARWGGAWALHGGRSLPAQHVDDHWCWFWGQTVVLRVLAWWLYSKEKESEPLSYHACYAYARRFCPFCTSITNKCDISIFIRIFLKEWIFKF